MAKWCSLLALALAMAGCGGTCPEGVLDPDVDDGCDCQGEEYEVFDNGETCECTADGLVCSGPTDSGE